MKRSTATTPLHSRFLEWALAGAALSLLLLHLTPNTVDPDLWGHVLFGRRIMETGHIEKSEPFSWTAHNAPWINHEILAEITMAGAHALAGGSGLLALKVLAGILAFAIALRLGMEGSDLADRMAAWAVAAVAAVEIGFGFACRPQVFTAVAVPLLFLLLRFVHERHCLWIVPLPFLFFVWFNTHGGALAGMLLLVVAALTTTLTTAVGSRFARVRSGTGGQVVLALWVAVLLSAAASLLNPWGWRLPVWLAKSVLWTRPEIQEWTATPFGWDHAVFFFLLVGVAASLLASRRPLRPWEVAMTVLLAMAATRHVRHTPLFALAALAVLPPHLTSALARLKPHTTQMMDTFGKPWIQTSVALALSVLCGLSLLTAWTGGKKNPLTMEIPTTQYPVDAIRFMQERGIAGNILVYFDWGEMCIWELPECRVSIDGRLDTCYPQDVIDTHWQIFRGELNATNPIASQADLALLPPDIRGTSALLNSNEWDPVYADSTAVVLRRKSGSRVPCPRFDGKAIHTERRIVFPRHTPAKGMLRQ